MEKGKEEKSPPFIVSASRSTSFILPEQQGISMAAQQKEDTDFKVPPTESSSSSLNNLLCSNDCGLAGGSPSSTTNMCQKCSNQSSPSTTSSDHHKPPRSRSPPPPPPHRKPRTVPVSVSSTPTLRCSGCSRKVGLTGFRCRCGELFCGDHRYSDRHDCSYDYKAAGREAISRENPVIKAAKIVRV